MKDLRPCEGCGGWREKYRACDNCGHAPVADFAPAEPPKPEGNSRSLQRMLRNKKRK